MRHVAEAVRLEEWESRAVDALARRAPFLLQTALGLVFVWFGGLKLANASPVADLVTR